MLQGMTVRDLTAATGTKPPAEFGELKASELDHLTALVVAAAERHTEAVEQAEENIIERVPRPARGAVRKVLKG